MILKKHTALKRYLTDTLQLEPLPESALAAVASAVTTQTYISGQTIVRHGEYLSSLYLILQGTVEVIGNTANDGGQVITCLDSGASFGESAVLRSESSADVRAHGDCTLLLLPVDVLREAFKDKEAALVEAVSKLMLARMAETNRQYAINMKQQLHIQKEKLLFGDFFVFVMSLLVGWNIMLKVLDHYSISLFNNPVAGWIILLLLVGSIGWFVKRSGFSKLEDYGLTLAGWQRALAEGGGITLIMLITFYFVFGQDQEVHTRWQHLLHDDSGFFIRYLLHASLQEIFVIGFFFGSLLRFISLERWPLAVFIFGLFAMLFHIHTQPIYMMSFFFIGCFAAILFMRHRNFFGLIPLHYFGGFCAKLLGVI